MHMWCGCSLYATIKNKRCAYVLGLRAKESEVILIGKTRKELVRQDSVGESKAMLINSKRVERKGYSIIIFQWPRN